MVKLTKLEQKVLKIIKEIDNFNEIHIQYKLDNYIMDIALPLKLINIEVDGESWLNASLFGIEEKIKKRDKDLEKLGWTVLRFDEKTIINNAEVVKQRIRNLL